jgi:hypothetical protein
MNNKNIFILHSYITRLIKLSKIYRNNKKTTAQDCQYVAAGFLGGSFGIEMYNFNCLEAFIAVAYHMFKTLTRHF